MSEYAIAHGEALVIVAPDGVEAAIAAVMARHVDELNVALKPYGVALDDLLAPTWMRFVRPGDVETLVSLGAPDAGPAEDLRAT